MPITAAEMETPAYVQGVSCPHCIDKVTDAQRQRFIERERQVNLAKARNEVHIGSEVNQVIEERRKQKEALRQRAAEQSRLKKSQVF